MIIQNTRAERYRASREAVVRALQCLDEHGLDVAAAHVETARILLDQHISAEFGHPERQLANEAAEQQSTMPRSRKRLNVTGSDSRHIGAK